jgi:hypothetical protein
MDNHKNGDQVSGEESARGHRVVLRRDVRQVVGEPLLLLVARLVVTRAALAAPAASAMVASVAAASSVTSGLMVLVVASAGVVVVRRRLDSILGFFKKRWPGGGLGSEPGIFRFGLCIFSFHHLTAR